MPISLKEVFSLYLSHNPTKPSQPSTHSSHFAMSMDARLAPYWQYVIPAPKSDYALIVYADDNMLIKTRAVTSLS